MNARETIDNFLHVYGQYSYHDEAVIRGTRTALLHLREAIDAALEKGKGSTELFATDGEGYELLVICASTIAAVGQPEYRINDEHEAEERRRERAAKLSAPCPSWDSNVVILPKSEVEAIREKALEEAAENERLKQEIAATQEKLIRANDELIQRNSKAISRSEVEALVEKAFRDGLKYGTICKVTDVDEAWRTSSAYAALRKLKSGGGDA